MPRFGITQEQLDQAKDQPIFLPGTKPLGVVLFHGWTSFPRQIKELAIYLNQLGYWVSAPMLRGHGNLPEDLENVSGEDWIVDAEKAVQELKKNPQIEKIVVGGTSMGGNLALLASQKEKVDGIISIATPVHLKNHFLIWLGTWIPRWIRRYQKKSYPRKITHEKEALGYTSYRYFPIKSVTDCLAVIRQSVFSLPKVTAPLLILQTSSDYLVTKYSPLVIYNAVRSKYKQLQWLKSNAGSHVLISPQTPDFFPSIKNFIQRIEKGEI